MPSCSRIARRCGLVDASRSGGAGAASATLPRLPVLLARPPARPVRRDEVVVLVRRSVGGSLDLDQVEDLEAIRAEEADPVAVPEVELHAAVGPLEPVHAEL